MGHSVVFTIYFSRHATGTISADMISSGKWVRSYTAPDFQTALGLLTYNAAFAVLDVLQEGGKITMLHYTSEYSKLEMDMENYESTRAA
jgi:hypothetical protein